MDMPNSDHTKIMIAVGQDFILCATNQTGGTTDYRGLIAKSLLALACMVGLASPGR